MSRNSAVAWSAHALFALTVGAAFAGAQTAQHYEARDENEAPADQTEDQQEIQAPAPAKRAVLTRPGGTQAEPNMEESASEPEAAISGAGQSLRATTGQSAPIRSKVPTGNAGGAAEGVSGEKSAAKAGRQDLPDMMFGAYTNGFLSQTGDRSFNFGGALALDAGSVCIMVSGQLPPGLAWDSSNCKIRGIATTVGVYNIIWKVQNQFGGDTANLKIEITNPARIRILTTRLPNAKVGVPYKALIVFQADLGVKGIYQSGVTHTLPPGLKYVYAEGGHSLTAFIVGTPTKAGSYQVPVYVCAGGNTNIGESDIFNLTVQP